MFNILTTSIDEEITLILKKKKANLFFLKTLIRYFDNNEILLDISMYDNYIDEEFEEFKRMFYYDLCDYSFLSDKETETLDNIIMMLFYFNKDDLIVSMQEAN